MKKLLFAACGLATLTACSTTPAINEFVPAPDSGKDCFTRLFTPKHKDGKSVPTYSYGPYCLVSPAPSSTPTNEFK